MTVRKAGLLAVCVALGGCAGPIVVNYAPSSTLSVKGVEKVGTFAYAPSASGKVKPNQIRNTAIGNIMLEKPISEYFQKAVFTESRFVGIDVGGVDPQLHGSIDEFVIDDLGYSIDWTLNVTYIVDTPGSSAPCFQKQKKLAKKTSKFANVFGTLNEVMKDSVEQLFTDPAFVACISSTNVAATKPAAPALSTTPGKVLTPSPEPGADEGFINFPATAPTAR